MIFQLVWIPCRWKPGFCLSKSEPSHQLTDTWGEKKNIPTDLQMDGATKTGPQRWLKTMEHKIFIYDFTRQIERCQCVQPMYKCVHHNRTIIYSHWHVYIYIRSTPRPVRVEKYIATCQGLKKKHQKIIVFWVTKMDPQFRFWWFYLFIARAKPATQIWASQHKEHDSSTHISTPQPFSLS